MHVNIDFMAVNGDGEGAFPSIYCARAHANLISMDVVSLLFP